MEAPVISARVELQALEAFPGFPEAPEDMEAPEVGEVPAEVAVGEVPAALVGPAAAGPAARSNFSVP
jgi:hypothetical protein